MRNEKIMELLRNVPRIEEPDIEIQERQDKAGYPYYFLKVLSREGYDHYIERLKESGFQKKLVAFCVGASPADNPEIEQTLPKNFSEEELKNIKWFYCPGGLDYEKMSVTSRMMMKTFVKFLKAKKDKTEKNKKN